MAGIDFRFYSFKDNIIDRVLTDIPCKNTIFILPTENSKRFAIREFRKKWTFSDTRFLTMEELKRTLFIADKPLLKNEKRAIAFYTALSEDDKSYFRISNYFQAHELSSNFFDLWSQFAEELVVENIDPHAFDSELLDWQINTYDRLLQIKRRYRKLLLDNGFEDTIFLYGSSRLQLEAFHPSDHFVFVNQFYYTRLEKDIIDKITNQNKQVILTYQLPESLVDREKLKVREFTLKDLNEFTAEEIDIIQSDNDFAAFRSLLQTLRDTGIQQVVDNSFLRQDYFRFLSPSAFRIGASTSFTDSSIYRFFAAFSEMMNEIVWEPIGREYLLPLEPLLNAIAIPDFVFYFCVEDKSEQQQHSYNSLYRLIEDDYRYIDLEGKVLDSVDPGDSPLRRILGFIDFFLGIGAVSEFVDWIDSTDRGVTVSRLVHSSEHMYSDILDTFYSTLADFNSLESLDFVNNWRLYFGNDRGHATVSSGLLRLFVDMLRSRTVRLSLHPPETSRVEITDLPDTRNMTYSQVAVLNLIEGEIPSKRRIPFLFTEKQRRYLNLKTYEDVKLREKYDFFRLILTTQRVFLFTQKNLAENIEPSSFIEELKLEKPCAIKQESKPDRYYLQFYRTILNCSEYSPHVDRVKNSDFYVIPLEKQRDFPENSMDLTFYDFKDLKENPFVYFLKRLCRIDNRPKEVTTDYTPKLIGNIVHDILDQIWRLILETGRSVGDFSKVDEDLIAGVFERVLRIKKKYYYQIPHDFATIYFDQIVKPNINKGISAFFMELADIGLKGRDMEIFPEYTESGEQPYRTLFHSGQNSLGLPVRIRGRADLRIHTPEGKYHIFDYKTGGADEEQLIFYELYYYLIEAPQLLDSVYSHFIHILSRKGDEPTGMSRPDKLSRRKDRLDKFQNDVLSQIETIVFGGFGVPGKKSSQQKWADVMRSDLFVHFGGRKNNC